MTKERLVTVRLNGPLRDAARRETVRLTLPPGSTAGELKRRLALALGPGPARYLERAAIADGAQVVADRSPVRGTSFDALPPVAGG